MPLDLLIANFGAFGVVAYLVIDYKRKTDQVVRENTRVIAKNTQVLDKIYMKM